MCSWLHGANVHVHYYWRAFEGRQSRAHLLLDGQHFRVHQDRRRHVERCGHALRELERGELAGQVLHSEGHAVRLPLQPVLDVELLEEIHHVRIRAEEDV
eukprot:6736977-Prymnesium_polylepis.1